MNKFLIERNFYLEKLISAMNHPVVKVITGIRRSGKSMLVFKLFYQHLLKSGISKDHIICVDLETQKNKPLRDSQKLYEFITAKIVDDKRYYVLLDEIQLVDEFEDVAMGLMIDDHCDVYLTGSNAKLLSKDINTRFRGRSEEIRVYPLCFSEYISYLVKTENAVDKSEALKQFMLYGGLPYVCQLEDSKTRINYLNSINTTVLFRDLIERYEIRNEHLFSSVIEFLCSNIGSYVSAKKISDTLKSNGFKTASVEAIGNYLNHLCDSFLFYKVNRYDVKGKAFLKTLNKYYISDLGLRNERLNFRQIELTHSLENLVYLELIKRGYSVDIGKNNEKEIDFIVNESGGNLMYIQVAYTLMGEGKMEQELSSFKNLNDGYKKIVITMDNDPFTQLENGYKKLNVFDFLLNEKSLEEV